MQFDKLYCNGNINPLGTGCEILLSWNYKYNGIRNEYQTAYSVCVETNNDVYNSGWIDGNAMQFCLSDVYKLQPGKIYHWTISVHTTYGTLVSPVQTFETAIDNLTDAAWIACGSETINAPVFIREFNITKPVKSARAYITGLGLFMVYCNDTRCTDHFLMPPNTLYDTFCYMETFDITEFLRTGSNRFSIQLGNGYDMSFSQFGYRYTGKKGLRCILQFTYENGEIEQIYSDDQWICKSSPILEDGLYRGEVYDASLTEFSESPAIIANETAPLGKILPNEMPPIRIVKDYVPVQSWDTEEGVVYDFGCNLQGITEICTEAPRGTNICMKHSEMLHADGTLDTETNREAAAEDVYICSGNGVETYMPTFTYHGFRYVLVSGIKNAKSFSIKAHLISSDVEHKSIFNCSDAMINRIHKLCDHSMRCNLVSIPTDCPVRDERTPCQMDSQMVEAAMIYNYNMYSYYKKWLLDITNTPYRNGEENPDWHGDYIMLAYRIYRLMGDMRPICQLYPKIKEDIELWMRNSDDGIYSKGFGDWCLPNDNTWNGIGECKTAVNTSLLYCYCCILEEIAGILHHEEDQKCCRVWKQTIRHSFVEHCINADGTVLSDRQPDLILPLYFGVLDGELQDRVLKLLLKKVEEDGHLDTGGFGTMALIPALAYAGGIDLIPKILNAGTYPGFGYWLSTGATSLWEQWALKGVMHSHSHEMYAGIDAAFYRIFCGVTVIEAGFRKFRVAPCIPQSMQFYQCLIQTVSGDIFVNVERLYGGIELTVKIPPNTQAVVTIPEWDHYTDCDLWDGERRIENKKNWELGCGIYSFRLVPRGNLR